MLSTIVSAAAAALTVPLTPAPARQIPPCAVYRYYPAGSDGMKGSAVFTVRVFASTVEDAAEELSRLRRALVSDGDAGRIGDINDPCLVRETAQHALSGYVREAGIYFLQAGFTISGRA
jgi:hypothetical protein